MYVCALLTCQRTAELHKTSQTADCAVSYTYTRERFPHILIKIRTVHMLVIRIFHTAHHTVHLDRNMNES